MNRILIQGLGCRDYGSLRILKDFIATNAELPLLVVELIPWGEGTQAHGHLRLPTPARFRGAARLLFELLLWATRNLQQEEEINLSNYGPASSPCSLLLLHNALQFEKHHDSTAASLVKRLLLRSSLSPSRLLVVQTSHMMERVLRFCREEGLLIPSIVVLRPRTDLSVATVLAPADDAPTCFYYPASEYRHKRRDFACETFSTELPEPHRAQLWMTGDFTESDAVKPLGFISEAESRRQLEKSHALFFSSTAESLGLPLVDALMLGKPAVLPELPYAREIYGDAGLYYSPDSSRDAAEKLGQLRREYGSVCEAVLRRREAFQQESLPPELYHKELVRLMRLGKNTTII